MDLPSITSIKSIKYPPGTRMVARHNPNLMITVTSVRSWHGYDTFVWDEKGVCINIHPQYNYVYDDRLVSGCCDENSLDEKFQVIEEKKLEDIRFAPTAGWSRPMRANKFHYFMVDDIVSVCGHWMLNGERDDTMDDHEDNCKACQKKVKVLRGQADHD
jgi:hypothetical protein